MNSSLLFNTRINRRTFGTGTALAIAGLATTRALPAFAHQDDAATTYPTLDIVSVDYAFEIPASVAGGLTTVTIANQGADFHHAMLVKLNDGVTLDTLLAAPSEAEMMQMGVSLGGPMAGPGGTSAVTLDLLPGSYAVICVIPGPDGMPHFAMGMAAPLEVTAPADPVLDAPVADFRIDLMEMMFHGIEPEVAAGPATWEVANVGGQMHELILFKADEGLTGEQLLEIFLAPPSATPVAVPAGPPPFAMIGGVAPMSPKHTAWIDLEFEPGNYVALCMVPDPATGAPHGVLGMAMPFTVA